MASGKLAEEVAEEHGVQQGVQEEVQPQPAPLAEPPHPLDVEPLEARQPRVADEVQAAEVAGAVQPNPPSRLNTPPKLQPCRARPPTAPPPTAFRPACPLS
jgi:hypothetical protein